MCFFGVSGTGNYTGEGAGGPVRTSARRRDVCAVHVLRVWDLGRQYLCKGSLICENIEVGICSIARRADAIVVGHCDIGFCLTSVSKGGRLD